MPTKEDRARIARMKERIATDPATAFKVLRVIWGRQQRVEQVFHEHAGHDGGRGFTPQDTAPLNELYERYEEAGHNWRDLRSADVVKCMRATKKYAWQFLEAERERREAELEASRSYVSSAFTRAEAAQSARAVERWGFSVHN